VEAAEVEEMWSFVGAKATERWLWHAIDHHTGRVLAYVVGTRKEVVLSKSPSGKFMKDYRVF